MKNKITMVEKSYIEVLEARSNQSLPLHSHECFCFGIVQNGTVRFRIGDQEKILKRGGAYLIPSNVGVTITTTSPYEYTTICLKGRLKELLSLYDYDNYFPQIESIEQIEEYCAKFMADGSCGEFFLDIYPYIQANQVIRAKKSTQNDSVELAKTYIKKHVMEEFDLNKLCDYVHMSKYYFIRVFKRETGVTPNQYYIQAKLYVVKQRLKTNEKETNVAADLNFADQSYLCNLFKKRMGISMKDFQKNYRSK